MSISRSKWILLLCPFGTTWFWHFGIFSEQVSLTKKRRQPLLTLTVQNRFSSYHLRRQTSKIWKVVSSNFTPILQSYCFLWTLGNHIQNCLLCWNTYIKFRYSLRRRPTITYKTSSRLQVTRVYVCKSFTIHHLQHIWSESERDSSSCP